MTRPPPHIVKAKKREIQVRHRNGRKFSMAPVRVAQLDRLLVSRYGQQLPDDDAGRDDARLVVHHLAQISGDAPARIGRWLARRAPWMPRDESEALITAAIAKPLRWGAKKLGEKIGLTWAERTALRITTFRATDISEADAAAARATAKQAAKRARRRAEGVIERETYEAAAIGHGKPWIAEGVSRATWYRQQQRKQPPLQ